jgi:quercetin dioxygenase-like cupin family protein
MSLTFINTNNLPRQSAPGHGEMTQVLNEALCGAKNAVGSLHWLKSGDKFQAEAVDKHQLVYLMDGSGRIELKGKSYDVAKGAGVYLGPSEQAIIEATSDSLRLFVLVVPKIPK